MKRQNRIRVTAACKVNDINGLLLNLTLPVSVMLVSGKVIWMSHFHIVTLDHACYNWYNYLLHLWWSKYTFLSLAVLSILHRWQNLSRRTYSEVVLLFVFDHGQIAKHLTSSIFCPSLIVLLRWLVPLQ